MTLEQFFTIFITLHAVSGSIALVAGTISIIAPKGRTWHKKSGIVFFYTMMLAGISGIIASVIPGHYNPFLFVIGIFSSYLVLSGYSALRFKKAQINKDILWDKILATLMLTVALGMITYGTLLMVKGSVMGSVLIIFGIIGGLSAFSDFKAFRDLKALRKNYLRMHIGKISGGYIAAFTAFLVTNNVLPGVIGWLLPSVLGGIFIVYWLKKTRIKKKPNLMT